MGSVSEEFPMWVQNATKEVPPQEAIKVPLPSLLCRDLDFTAVVVPSLLGQSTPGQEGLKTFRDLSCFCSVRR
jgi:hypothetical protein